MATKRQITLRFKDEYAKASKKDKGVILDRMCETLKIGRSTARRRLKEAGRGGRGPTPASRLVWSLFHRLPVDIRFAGGT